MKNIEIYKGDSYLFHKKNLIHHPSSLLTQNKETALEKAFIEYEIKYILNTFEEIKKYDFLSDVEKKAHLNLYKHESKNENIFEELLIELTSDTHGRKKTLCPFCEFAPAKTLDHFLPKNVDNGFPEFCDMPLNLIPMCSDCNNVKKESWLDENDKIKFINIYRDKLPEKQYLFVDLFTTNNCIEAKFYLDLSKVDIEIARKIENTYDTLDLLKKYNQHALLYIGELSAHIKIMGKYLLESEIKKNVLSEYRVLNNWKHVLFRKCVLDNNIYQYIMKYDNL